MISLQIKPKARLRQYWVVVVSCRKQTKQKQTNMNPCISCTLRSLPPKRLPPRMGRRPTLNNPAALRGSLLASDRCRVADITRGIYWTIGNKPRSEVVAPLSAEKFLGLSATAWGPIGDTLLTTYVTFLATVVALSIVKHMKNKLDKVWGEMDHSKRRRDVLLVVFKSIYSPVTFFLPVVAAFHVLSSVSATLDELLMLCGKCSGLVKYEDFLAASVSVFKTIDAALLKFFSISAGALGVWCLVSLKDQYVIWTFENPGRRGPEFQELKRIVLPLNSLASWVLIGSGVMLTFFVLGVDIKPLLAFGSVSGIVMGLAAQSVVANMISGIQLFLSRPFMPGDRIEVLASNGNLILRGIVENVQPLRTVIRTDKQYPMEVPNKVLANLIIGNESRFITKPEAAGGGGRRVVVAAKLDISHLDNAEEITSKITKVAGDIVGVNKFTAYGATLSSITESNIIIEIQASTLERIASHTAVRLKLVIAVRNLLAEMGIEGAQLTF